MIEETHPALAIIADIVTARAVLDDAREELELLLRKLEPYKLNENTQIRTLSEGVSPTPFVSRCADTHLDEG